MKVFQKITYQHFEFYYMLRLMYLKTSFIKCIEALIISY